MKKLYIGIDVGGTNIKSGLVYSDGKTKDITVTKLVEDWKYYKGLTELPKMIYREIKRLINNNKLADKQISGIGIAVASPITSDGIISETTTFSKSIQRFNLHKEINKLYPAKYCFAVDTQAAAYGEFKSGAGKGYNNILAVFCGTGIGGGVIIDGKLLLGSKGIAGPIGHTIVMTKNGLKCICGSYGCLETISSAGAIVKKAIENISKGKLKILSKLCNYDIQNITPHLVYIAAKKKDKDAINIFAETGYYLGIAILNAITIISPEIVILGGGLAEAGDFIIKPIQDIIKKMAFPKENRKIKIVKAKLGLYSGVIGAAKLV
ncbi:MAG: ROK family protein [Candidatus Firestonebacteria bacterium]